jgi:5,10-methylenetetrahydromethanopterin reductase
MMEFGLFVMGHRDCVAEAVQAERAGFSSVGVVDSQLLGAETFVALTRLAMATSKIRIGPLLAIPGNRSAEVAAQGIASVNLLAPGRTFFATGTGYTSRLSMGLSPLKATTVRDFARTVRTLLDGGEVAAAGDGPPVRFRQAEDQYIDLDHRIPIYVAGDGPRAMKAAGESGEGWITTLQRAPMMTPMAVEVFSQSLATVRAAGTGTPGIGHTVLSTSACVLRPGEQVMDDRVIARIGPAAMLPFHSAAQNPDLVDLFPPSWRDRYPIYRRNVLDRIDPSRLHQEVHRGHLTFLLDGEAEVLNEDIIRGTTLTGTREELVDHLGSLSAAGLDEVVLNFPHGLAAEGIAEVASELRSALS